MKKTEVRCNYCGRIIEDKLEEFLEVYYSFGYGTELDGTEVTFDLCEDCLLILFTLFEYSPDVTDDRYMYLEKKDSLDFVIEKYKNNQT